MIPRYIMKRSHTTTNKNEINPGKRRQLLSTRQEEDEDSDARSEASEVVEFETPCTLPTDTEAAIEYVKNTLLANDEKKKNANCSPAFPPIVFVHQLYDIIKNKTVVNREIEVLRNKKKIIVIHLGNEECMKITVLFDDLKSHVLEKCEASEKFLLHKFFDKVLATVVDIGISRVNLITKFRFSERDIRFLVNIGLLILKDTGIFWFSFPSAGIFMKKLIKGRQQLLTSIKKRRYHEVLEREIKNLPVSKSLELPMMYHVHDLVGGGFVHCVRTSSGRLLRAVNSKTK